MFKRTHESIRRKRQSLRVHSSILFWPTLGAVKSTKFFMWLPTLSAVQCPGECLDYRPFRKLKVLLTHRRHNKCSQPESSARLTPYKRKSQSMNRERLTFVYSNSVAFTFSSNPRVCLTKIRVSTLFCQHFVVDLEMMIVVIKIWDSCHDLVWISPELLSLPMSLLISLV